MRDARAVLWFGPVSAKQIGASVPAPYELAVRGCTGDGSDGKAKCLDHAAAWLDANGRRLPKARAALGVPIESEVAAMAAFSAGGQIVKRICLHPEDRAELGAVYLADATYTDAWEERGKWARVDDLLEGFVLFALDALADGRIFVATASSSANQNGKYPSGAQTLAAIWEEIERRSGRTFEDAAGDAMLTGTRPLASGRAGRMGSLLLVDFGAVYKHGEHATQLAPLLLPRVLGHELQGSNTNAQPLPEPAARRPAMRGGLLGYLFSQLLRRPGQ